MSFMDTIERVLAAAAITTGHHARLALLQAIQTNVDKQTLLNTTRGKHTQQECRSAGVQECRSAGVIELLIQQKGKAFESF